MIARIKHERALLLSQRIRDTIFKEALINLSAVFEKNF